MFWFLFNIQATCSEYCLIFLAKCSDSCLTFSATCSESCFSFYAKCHVYVLCNVYWFMCYMLSPMKCVLVRVSYSDKRALNLIWDSLQNFLISVLYSLQRVAIPVLYFMQFHVSCFMLSETCSDSCSIFSAPCKVFWFLFTILRNVF